MSPQSGAKPSVQSQLGSDLLVGELLHKGREQTRESLEQIEKATKIRRRYLELIEKSDYEHLPDDVYSLGYIKSYADHLGFETAPIVSMYRKERLAHASARVGGTEKEEKRKLGLQPVGNQGLVISSKSLLIGFAILIFVVIASYLGFQVASLAAPPTITLNSTAERVSTNYVIVSGETDTGADVYINDSPILTNPDGSFSERVAVVDGTNQITVLAKNRLGKSTSITKTVNASLAKSTDAPAEVSAVPVDGVELLIKVKNQATWVVVSADGQDLFRGTMLLGTQQLFKAKSSLKLTTGNAGNTEATISNLNVAGRDLGTLGRSGEAKIDLVFQRDTQFQ